MAKQDLYLFRLVDNSKETLGVMAYVSFENVITVDTVELPFKNNRNDVSCIPPGTYEWEKYDSPTHGTVIRLKDVPGRTNIEFHPANFVRELRGCIAPGTKFRDIDGDGLIDVEHSRDAFNLIMSELGESGYIHISEARLSKVNK